MDHFAGLYTVGYAIPTAAFHELNLEPTETGDGAVLMEIFNAHDLVNDPLNSDLIDVIAPRDGHDFLPTGFAEPAGDARNLCAPCDPGCSAAVGITQRITPGSMPAGHRNSELLGDAEHTRVKELPLSTSDALQECHTRTADDGGRVRISSTVDLPPVHNTSAAKPGSSRAHSDRRDSRPNEAIAASDDDSSNRRPKTALNGDEEVGAQPNFESTDATHKIEHRNGHASDVEFLGNTEDCDLYQRVQAAYERLSQTNPGAEGPVVASFGIRSLPGDEDDILRSLALSIGGSGVMADLVTGTLEGQLHFLQTSMGEGVNLATIQSSPDNLYQPFPIAEPRNPRTTDEEDIHLHNAVNALYLEIAHHSAVMTSLQTQSAACTMNMNNAPWSPGNIAVFEDRIMGHKREALDEVARHEVERDRLEKKMQQAADAMA